MNFPQPSLKYQQSNNRQGQREVGQLNRRNQNVSVDEVVSKTKQLGSIYLGNIEAAINIDLLKKKQIKYVLTLGSNIRIDYKKRIKQFEKKEENSTNNHNSTSSVSSNESAFKIDNMNIDIDDEQYSDMSRYFQRTQRFIHNGRQNGNVLVHCMMGISRSATIVIAYIMQTNKTSFQKAFKMVKNKRNCVFPNKGFVRQLNELEKYIQIQSSQASSLQSQNNSFSSIYDPSDIEIMNKYQQYKKEDQEDQEDLKD